MDNHTEQVSQDREHISEISDILALAILRQIQKLPTSSNLENQDGPPLSSHERMTQTSIHK